MAFSRSTPPWRVEIDPDTLWVMVYSSDAFPVAQCFNFEGIFPKVPIEFEVAKVNGQMISALPELLDACKDALESIQVAQKAFGDSIARGVFEGAFLFVEKHLCAAIAKAEGKKGE